MKKTEQGPSSSSENGGPCSVCAEGRSIVAQVEDLQEGLEQVDLVEVADGGAVEQVVLSADAAEIDL